MKNNITVAAEYREKSTNTIITPMYIRIQKIMF